DGGDEDQAVRTLAAGEWQGRFFHALGGWGGDHGVAATRQGRFARRGGGGWREGPPVAGPPLGVGEAMGGGGLFVGVTSIAADPDWSDRGEDRYVAYWRTATFGELTASAEARRDALERILPRLRIADRCSLDGRYLQVRGDLGSYRIHLGSSNILM